MSEQRQQNWAVIWAVVVLLVLLPMVLMALGVGEQWIIPAHHIWALILLVIPTSSVYFVLLEVFQPSWKPKWIRKPERKGAALLWLILANAMAVTLIWEFEDPTSKPADALNDLAMAAAFALSFYEIGFQKGKQSNSP